jgi:hypothetical protein
MGDKHNAEIPADDEMTYTYKINASLKFFLLTFQDNVKNKEKIKNVLCMNCWMKFAQIGYIQSHLFSNTSKIKINSNVILL